MRGTSSDQAFLQGVVKTQERALRASPQRGAGRRAASEGQSMSDLVILSADHRAGPVAAIKESRACSLIGGGRVVFQADRPIVP